MTPSPMEWTPAEPDCNAVLARFDQPLHELASGRIPAIVLRGAWPRAACEDLVERLVAEELLYDPALPVPEKFREQIIPEGYYREGRNQMATLAWQPEVTPGKARIDIGTSLGYRGSDPDAFFAHSAETIRVFERLFADRDNPIELIYRSLQRLSRTHRVVTAHESDGRSYGPAIVRAHYGGYTYRPHFDSVRLREKRQEYAVCRFDHQFAGVLVLQNATASGRTAQGILHHCLWNEEVEPHLTAGQFHDYAREQGIEKVEVRLEPGDLYFFNTRLIHEVPGVNGTLPRIVLATFIGYSADREEIFVWS